MNLREIHERLSETGREKARTAAYHTTTDRLRKEIRAKVMVEHLNRGETLGKSEQLALIDERYIEAAENAEQAEEAAGIAAVEYEAARAWMSAWQTMEASRREEMKITKGAV